MSWGYLKYRTGRSRFEYFSTIALLLLMVCIVVALILPALQQDRRSRRNEVRYNVKQAALAAMNFNGSYERFPPYLPGGTIDPNVTKPTGFFTPLLPWLEYGWLYKTIDTTVFWTHPKNFTAYQTRVNVLEWPAESPVDYENDRTKAGYAISHLSPNSRIVSTRRDPVRTDEITDGTATTILLGTIDDSAVPAWGDPTNKRDPANGFGGGPRAFGGFPEWGAVMVFADGHVDNLSKKIDPKVAKALATPAGGEIVGDY